MDLELNTDDLKKFMNTGYRVYASSVGNGSDKSLRCYLRGGYQVWNNGVCLVKTISARVAINKYNTLK